MKTGTAADAGDPYYCEACRHWIEGAGVADELHFCDRCNVSVAVSEIRDGRASFLEGRLFCPRCAQSRSVVNPVEIEAVAAPRGLARHPRSQRRPGAVRVAGSIALMAVAVVAVVAALLFPERIAYWMGRESNEADSAEPATPSLREGLAAEDRSTADATREIDTEELLAAIGGLEGRLERVEGRIEGLATEPVRLPEEVVERLDALEQGVAAMDDASRALLESIGEDIAGLREELADVGDRLAELGAVDPGAESSPSTGPAGEEAVGSDPGPPEAGEGDSPIDRVLRDLESPDAGRRFSALVEIGRLASPEHVPVVAEVLLTDEDLVVRELAANILGNLGDGSAVDPLIRSLRDPAVSVVMAADDALQRITKRSSGMKRRLGTEARLEVVRKWEEWWERNRDSRR